MAGNPETDLDDTPREESKSERLDRNLSELLQELRVALPGVQVLFAFLLVVPFNNGFAEVTSFQKTVYFVTLLLVFAVSVCLIAPTVHHRILFRQQDKERILQVANRLAIIGLFLLAFALVGVLLLITDFIYTDSTATAAIGGLGLVLALVWFGIPLRRLQDKDRS